MACNMVALDEKAEVDVSSFPDNETVKQLHNTTSLLYRTYGGVEEEAPPYIWDTSEIDDSTLIAVCDAAKRAYDRKRQYQATLKRFQKKSLSDFGKFTFDLGISYDKDASVGPSGTAMSGKKAADVTVGAIVGEEAANVGVIADEEAVNVGLIGGQKAVDVGAITGQQFVDVTVRAIVGEEAGDIVVGGIDGEEAVNVGVIAGVEAVDVVLIAQEAVDAAI